MHYSELKAAGSRTAQQHPPAAPDHHHRRRNIARTAQGRSWYSGMTPAFHQPTADVHHIQDPQGASAHPQDNLCQRRCFQVRGTSGTSFFFGGGGSYRLFFWWRGLIHSKGAHTRLPHPDWAARPALMRREAHAVESKAVVRIEVFVPPQPQFARYWLLSIG